MKWASNGLKNDLTNLRIDAGILNEVDSLRLTSLNNIFLQDFLGISTLDQTLVLLSMHKLGRRFRNQGEIHGVLALIADPYYIVHYFLFLFKSNVNMRGYTLWCGMVSMLNRSNSYASANYLQYTNNVHVSSYPACTEISALS